MIEPVGPQPEFRVILPFRDALPEFRDCAEAIIQEAEEYGSAEDESLDCAGEVRLMGARKPSNTLTSIGERIRCSLTEVR